MSFDSQHSQPIHSHSQPMPQPFNQSFPNGPVSNPGYARSFGDPGYPPQGYGGKPQIYTVSLLCRAKLEWQNTDRVYSGRVFRRVGV